LAFHEIGDRFHEEASVLGYLIPAIR